jgi:hypothetical protein
MNRRQNSSPNYVVSSSYARLSLDDEKEEMNRWKRIKVVWLFTTITFK